MYIECAELVFFLTFIEDYCAVSYYVITNTVHEVLIIHSFSIFAIGGAQISMVSLTIDGIPVKQS